MQNIGVLMVGVVCLVVSGLALFKLAPGNDGQEHRLMERESVAVGVALAVVILMTFGVGLLFKAFI
jgi:hypothetical protein